ncbi:MAG: hypothetical protein ACK5Z5_06490 [Neisseriaceae bacterium]
MELKLPVTKSTRYRSTSSSRPSTPSSGINVSDFLTKDEQKKLHGLIQLMLVYWNKKTIRSFLIGQVFLDDCFSGNLCFNHIGTKFGVHWHESNTSQFSLLLTKISDKFSDILSMKQFPLSKVSLRNNIKDMMSIFFKDSYFEDEDTKNWKVLLLSAQLLEDQEYVLDLSGMLLNGLNLDMVNMNMVNIKNANLCGADFSGARFESYMRLNIFDNLEYTYKYYYQNYEWRIKRGIDKFLTENFDHLSNKNRCSWLTAINSIDNTYMSIKTDAMNQIIIWLKSKKVNIVTIIKPLCDVLLKDIIYWQNKNTSRFTKKEILPVLIRENIYGDMLRMLEGELDEELYATLKKYRNLIK